MFVRGALGLTLTIGLCATMIHAEESASEPVLHMRAEATFDKPVARSGDTVQYRLRITWNEVPAAVMLLPREPLDIPGFLQVGTSVTHSRSTTDSVSGNVTEYTDLLIAQNPGMARVASFSIRYHNGLTGREESIGVPALFLNVTPAPRPFWERPGVRFVAFPILIIAATAGILGGWRVRRRAGGTRRQGEERETAPSPDAAAVESLQARCDAADSRLWLRDAEQLCIGWLCRHLGVSNPAKVRFEAALEQYLGRKPGLAPSEKDSWITLRDLFHEARYAGIRREPHELYAICRHLKTCLLQDGEPSK